MPRTKTAKKTKEEEDELPQWAENEIKNVKFNEEERVKRTGYILEIYEKDNKMDIQVYEGLADGRTIVEGIDIAKSMNISSFSKGVVYEFNILIQKARLSKDVVELLISKFNIEMEYIYKFELQDAQQMDVESDIINDEQPSEDIE